MKQHAVAEEYAALRKSRAHRASWASATAVEATQEEEKLRGGAQTTAITPATYRRASQSSSDLPVAVYDRGTSRTSASHQAVTNLNQNSERKKQ